MANLKQLSQKLGLSQTTVSRALNGYPEVSEKTRQRVMDAARDHDYQPNSNAWRLATGQAKTIGHVVPLASHEMINPHFNDFIAGASKIYNQHGYDMLISVVEVEKEADTYRALKRDGRVDGVIVHGPLENDSRIGLLQELGLPFVVHGRTLDESHTYNWVDVNNRRAFFALTEKLIVFGHKQIALINGFENMVFAINRRQGFEEALRANGLAINPFHMISHEMTEPQGYSGMKHLLDMETSPTAVICSSMLSALGALRALNERGMKPGQDVSLACFDDCLSFLGVGEDRIGIAAMRSSIADAGGHCAKMLIDAIANGGKISSLLLDAEFVDAPSIGPAS